MIDRWVILLEIEKKNALKLAGISILIWLICGFFVYSGAAFTTDHEVISLASYNVENLFDLKKDSTEYPGYIPGGRDGWNREMLNTKLDHLARVIDDLSADILALQEVESGRALASLNGRLRKPYPYTIIADRKPTTVKCALMSRYPVVEVKEIAVPGKTARNILKAEIRIADHSFVVFNNHWKSKTGPESRRLPYARALADAIERLDADADFVIVGDLNSNYNEFETFKNTKELNDTKGTTGINHILNTVRQDRLVSERMLNRQMQNQTYLYNLWLELKDERRWSTQFFSHRSSPDHIIVSPGLYDNKGVSYIDNSFDKFDPGYLFRGERIRRWQRTKKGRGRHLGEGFSDHLPIFAWLAPGPFSYRPDAPYPEKTLPIAALYESKTGRVNYHLNRCAVIYRHRKYTIIKQRNGRAILAYGTDEQLRQGQIYDLTVKYLKRYYGMLEITKFASVESGEKRIDLTEFFIRPSNRSLNDSASVNEVVLRIKGFYRNGWLYYGENRKIRLFARDKGLLPDNGSSVILKNIRIGFHRHPELVLESSRQIIVNRVTEDE